MPVRVLHIVTYMGRGGLETMLMNYYRHIDRCKVQFDFLVHREFEADYDAEIHELGGKIYHISRLIPWSHSYRRKLKHFFQEHPEYKIVHVHQDCLSSVALQCAMECGVPVRIAHSHTSSAVRNMKYPIKKHYMKKIPVYATELFACGKLAGIWMFQGKDFKVIPNGICVQDYMYSEKIREKVRKELGVENNVVIGHVGNFTRAKNHEFLLMVFAEILKKEPSARLILVGSGGEQEKIQKLTVKLKIWKNVIFMGTRSDVNELMQAMDIFVFPSLYEGLPVTMIETQAAGLPCVISDHVSNECRIVQELVTVMKLSDSPLNWADHILSRVIEGRRDCSEEIIKAGYDIETASKNLEEFYLKIYERQGIK